MEKRNDIWNNKIRMEPFHTVVVTSPDSIAAKAALDGPLQRTNLPFNGKICPKVLSTSDPFDTRMGSGGGTLAAIEHCDVHNKSNEGSVLIIHAGGQSSRCPTQMTLGKAWTDLPIVTEEGMKRTNPTYILMRSLSSILQNLPCGSVVIAASDVLLSLPNDPITFDGVDDSDVIGLAVPAPLNTAKNHGVFAIDDDEVGEKDQRISSGGSIKPVDVFFQKPSVKMMKECKGCTFLNDGEDMAWIDTGVIVFLPKAADTLRELMKDELSLYTKGGIEDTIAQDATLRSIPVKEAAKTLVNAKLELYSHLLLAISTKRSLHNTDESRLDEYLNNGSNADISKDKLKEIFQHLSKNTLQVCVIPEGSFIHLGTTRELSDFLIAGAREKNNKLNDEGPIFKVPISLASRLEASLNGTKIDSNCVIMNSILDSKKSNYGNSLVGKGCIIEHCSVGDTTISIGDHCVVSGLRGKCHSPIVIPSGMVFQMLPLREKSENGSTQYVCMFLGMDDGIKKHDNCYGVPFGELLTDTKLALDDLWNENDSNHNLWDARIHPIITLEENEVIDWTPFLWIYHYIESKKATNKNPIAQMDESDVIDWEPFLWIHRYSESRKDINAPSIQSSLNKWKGKKRLSLSQIQGSADASCEFSYRAELTKINSSRELQTKIESMKYILRDRRHEELKFDFIVRAIHSGSSRELFCTFEMLQALTVSEFNQGAYDICSRCFMILGSLLGSVAKNIETETSNVLGDSNHLRPYVRTLKSSDDPSDRLLSIETILEKSKILLREALNACDTALIEECATEMEEVAFSLTALCVITSEPDLSTDASLRPPLGSWVVSSAPARIDLSGGWTDTPPVSYEFGGAVSCLAVTINNQKPLSARCRRVENKCGIILRTENRDINTGDLLDSDYVQISEMKDLSDFRDPRAKCALSKCALIALGLVPTSSIHDDNAESIGNYINLGDNEFEGIELISTSLLPHGSGMGTSSILASCVLASLGGCLGLTRVRDMNYLTKTVLDLEQLLSTGGGWQDQVGGLYGGLKLCTAKINELPVCVQVKEIALSKKTINNLNHRLLLAFTGQPRLAKNILQKVLRQWAGRSAEIMKTVTELVENANKCVKVIKEDDLTTLGSLMSSYWALKKKMAGEKSGVEPREVTALLKILTKEAIIDGGTLAGAGGGGFLALLLSEGKSLKDIEGAIARCADLPENTFTWFECNVCPEGLTTSIQHSDLFQIQWHSIDNL